MLGPIATPRRVQDEETTMIPSDTPLSVKEGTPVICNGMEENAILNGKIGEVRGTDEARGCLIIRFEEKELGEHPVQKNFLRILFELPEEGP